ncbi:MAG: DUF3300 domain-containing protein [Rhizomicrobium sp.]
MRLLGAGIAALFFCAATIVSTGCFAQGVSAPAAQGAAAGAAPTADQLDQLVAPVALYPDPLLADVLTASTYPLEVVEADRWVSDPENAPLAGDAQADALNDLDWDPSVKSLAPFPDVLQSMDTHLDWMEALGRAFLAEPAAIMDAVQRLRARAQSAGNLASNGEETVTGQDGAIAISPPPSDIIDVPEYDPWCAFGDWSMPVSTPYYFSPWEGACDPAEESVEFGPGIAWPFDYWDWGYFDWRHRHLLIRPNDYKHFHRARAPNGNVWRHDPTERGAGLPRAVAGNTRAVAPFDRGQAFHAFQAARVSAGPARQARSAYENFRSGQFVRARPQRGMATRRGFSAGFGRGVGHATKSGGSRGRGGH